MEAEMQRAGSRALQAQGTAGAKALRQDPTRQTRQKQQGPLELRGRGRRAGDRGWQGSDQQGLWAWSRDVAFMPRGLQDFKQKS